MSEVFFTSDLHINHSNIIKYCDRPFDSADEMNEALVENFQAVVKPGDRVYCLGDFQFVRGPKEEHAVWAAQMPGQWYLTRGNHDHPNKWDQSLTDHFVWIRDYAELRFKDRGRNGHPLMLVLFHYPIQEWNKMHWGSVQLHGHIHRGRTKEGHTEEGVDVKPGRLDVGVDNAYHLLGEYRPFHLDEVLELIDLEAYWEYCDSIR